MGYFRYNRGNKYGAKKVKIDAQTFDSEKEGKRYAFLKLMERAGEISNLQTHVRYEILPKVEHTETVQLKTKTKVVAITDQRAVFYTADFVYTNTKTGEEIVEDVKGSKSTITKDAELRFKMFFFRYHKKVRIVLKHNEPIG